jgi:hypothetical protein
MTELKIERDKLYKLRNGEIVRVVCVDVPGNYPLMGYAVADSARYLWCADGKNTSCGTSPYDIIAEHREPRTFWVKPHHADISGGLTNKRPDADDIDEWIQVREVLPE